MRWGAVTNTRSKQATPAYGFALLEALTAVAIIGVLAAIALPSFQAVSARLKVRSTVDALTTSFYLARVEAIKRGGHVTLTKTPDSADCSTVKASLWSCGWTVFADDDDDGIREASEEMLQANSTPPGIEVTQTAGRKAISFNAWGVFPANAGLGFIVRSKGAGGAVHGSVHFGQRPRPGSDW